MDVMKKWRSLTRDPVLLSVFFTLWGLMFLFIIFPLGALIWKIFFTEKGFTLETLINTIGYWQNRKALYDSLILASLTASSSVILGFLFAFTTTRTYIHWALKKFLNSIIIIPLISPPFLAAFSIVLAFGRRGIIVHSILGLQNVNIYGLPGTWISETLTYFPTAGLVFMGVLLSMNPNLEEAAFTLGDSRLGIWRKVTLPLAVPGIANAFLLVFAESLADFATPLILSGSRFPLLPVQAYLQVTGMYDMAGGAALAFMLLVPAFIVFVLQKYWVERRSRVSVLGKPRRKTEIRLVGKTMEMVLLGACLSVVVVILVLYSLILYGSFVQLWGVNGAFTFKHYMRVFTFGAKAIKDTLTIAWIVSLLGGIIGLLIAYLVIRQPIFGKGVMEFTSMLNYALPGTTVGIAYLIAFNHPPFAITGTLFILIVCFIFRYNSVSIRSAIASLQQIDPSIEEASTNLGANLLTTFRKVTVPMIIPAFFSGLEYLYIRSFTAISAVIFLVSVHTQLITVRILENLTEMDLGQAAAFSVVLIILVLAGTGIFHSILHFVGRRGFA